MERIEPKKFKFPSRKTVIIDGISISLSALSAFDIEKTSIYAIDRLKSFEFECSNEMIEIEIKVQIISASSDTDPSLIREAFTVHQINLLYEHWRAIQNQDVPDVGWLSLELRKRMVDDDETIMDGFRAKHATSVVDYFGRTIDKLTDGQIIYYQCLINAYDEIRGSVHDGTTKYVSKKWLNGNLRN